MLKKTTFLLTLACAILLSSCSNRKKLKKVVRAQSQLEQSQRQLEASVKELTAKSATPKSMYVSGYMTVADQLPVTPTTQLFAVYVNPIEGPMLYARNAGGFVTQIKLNGATANRVITIPDADGNLAAKLILNGQTYAADKNGVINLGTIIGGSSIVPEFPLYIEDGKLKLSYTFPNIKEYANDAAATADTALPANTLYRVTGNNTIRIKLPTEPIAPAKEDVADGWATGTTGGAGGPTVVVKTKAEWEAAKEGDDPKIIVIEGSFNIGSHSLVGSNKTIIGTAGTLIKGNIRIEAKNVIVREVTITSEEGEPEQDCIAISNHSEMVWIYKNTIYDWTDGACDVTKGSTKVTISYNKFYQTKSYEHALAVLIGASPDDPDEGLLKTSVHHNDFGPGITDRMPFVRKGEIDIWNNYYHSDAPYIYGGKVSSYTTAATNAKIRARNSFYENGEDPFMFKEEGGKIWASGNHFESAVDNVSEPMDPGTFPEPPYKAVLQTPAEAKATVLANAGAPVPTQPIAPAQEDVADGWATGTTGGAGGPTVVVKTKAEWEAAKEGDDPKIIVIEGSFNIGSHSLVGSNKTIIGTAGTLIKGNIRIEARNVIVREVTITSEEGEPEQDCIAISNHSEMVWIYKNTIYDWTDGACDVTKGSTKVTISYNKFYQTKSYEHALAVLIGASPDDPDEGLLKTSVHHNDFGPGITDRMPFVRKGEIDLWNNYYHCDAPYIYGGKVSSYTTAATNAKIRARNSFYENGEDPFMFKEEGGKIWASGNKFEAAVLKPSQPMDSGTFPETPYKAVLQTPDEAKATVLAKAGAPVANKSR